MEVYDSLDNYQKSDKPAIATIGTFDGLHIGHRKILRKIIQEAKGLNGESVLISFYPHPRLVLFPEKNNLRLLHSLDEKREMLEEMGLDKLLLIPFTKEFSRTPPKVFVRKILWETVGIKKIVIGYDHRFGKNRAGDIHKLQALSREFQYEVEEIPAQAIEDANVSSTKIREALFKGDVRTANAYLGYTYHFTGKVIHGEKQGRKLGYPTANIQMEYPYKLIPSNGVYFVHVQLPGSFGDKSKYGMMNIGHKPTMGEFERGIEVYLFDFQGDLYGQPLTIQMLEYLRPEQKFDSKEALVQAIDGDRDRSLDLIQRYKDRVN